MTAPEKLRIEAEFLARRDAQHERAVRRGHARWTTFANGRVYRPVMKVMHRLGWCYPVGSLVERGEVWCHWCGMRGRQ